ncbi:dipicolinate synthase subunit B [Thermodesulfitimonas autotrophica]|uniref:Dipicolinate synthase subunit B n=1 Tax=Thermodesulfitimonas autotrophica TaxID=1894989 RepID=A0A3N5APW4_9THEO|nr:dipicolinate synthase subunit B [Thermodesulfitimonas autotrophica]RPF46877.1 dipicolinate synthase subunit B [Thermodesulfitimonas autotrophica]
MRLKGRRIGFALTGSFCTLKEVVGHIAKLIEEGAEVIPIVSREVATTDTRFGTAAHWKSTLQELTGNAVIDSIVTAEPIGPKKLLDLLVVAPCTGNTLAKLANAITDGPVLMAIKAQLRNQRPVVLAIATNDGLGMNARNLGVLLNAKNIYMVPFGQDNPKEKPNSLVARMDLLLDTILYALEGKQIQPIVISYPNAS